MVATRIVLALVLSLLIATPAKAALPPGWTSLGKDWLTPGASVTHLEFDAENNGYAVASMYDGSSIYKEIVRPATGGTYAFPAGEEQILAVNPSHFFYDVDDAGRGSMLLTSFGEIYERHRFADTWSDPVMLGTGADSIATAFADDGSGVLAWATTIPGENEQPGSYMIRVRPRTAAGVWQAAETVFTSQTDRYASTLAVAHAPDGSSTVMWSDTDPTTDGGSIRQATRLSGQTEFAAPEVVHSQANSNTVEPVLAMDKGGNATILWVQNYSGELGCNKIGEVTRSSGSATFGEPTWPAVSQSYPDGYYNCNFGNVRIAVAGDGAIAVYFQGDGYSVPTQALNAAVREMGARFTAIPVLRDVAYQQYQPALAGGPDGSFMLTLWGDNQGGGFSGLETFLARPGEAFTPVGNFPGFSYGEPEFDKDSVPFVGLNASGATAEIVAFDDQGPEITGLIAPDGFVGQELTFGFTAIDAWSTVDSAGAKWTFSKTGLPTKQATGAAPKLTFTADEIGTWTVSVEVADGNGNKTTRTGTFKITAANQAPAASFTVSPEAPKAQEDVTLNGSASSDPDGHPLTYAWDFDNDGTVDKTGGDAIAVVKYAAGTHTAKLTVSDAHGGTASTTRTITVTAVAEPTPTPTPGPTTPTSNLPKNPPAPGAGDAALEAAALAQGLDITTPSFVFVSSRREREVPNVVGLPLDTAEEKLAAVHHIDYEIKWVHKLPKGSKAKIGSVVAQEPKPGAVVDSGVADLLKVVVTVYAGPKAAKNAACPTGFEKIAKGIDWDLGRQLIAESCKKKPIDQLSYKLGKHGEPIITRAKRDGRKLDLTVGIPSDPKEHDLFMVFREVEPGWRNQHHTFNGNWELVSNPRYESCFSVQVFDRQKFFVQNAVIEVDISRMRDNLTAQNFKFKTNAKGSARICESFQRRDARVTIPIVAHATGRNGDMVFGATRITLVKPPNEFQHYTTPSGRYYNHTAREVSPPAKKKTRKPGQLLARAAFWDELLKSGQRLAGEFTTAVTSTVSSAVSAVVQPLQQLAASLLQTKPTDEAAWRTKWEAAYKSDKLQPGNINAGGTLNADVFPVIRSTGKVWSIRGGISPKQVAESVANAGGAEAPSSEVNKVIASGGGNLTDAAVDALRRRADGSLMEKKEIAERFANGGMVIASGGGNVIASGGGNVIASGGGNIAAIIAGVIASGGGNVLSGEIMKNLIGQAGTNVIASGGGNVIASGGGNLLGQAGTNFSGLTLNDLAAGVIASGGGNLLGQAGTNLIGQAGTNLIGQAGTNLIDPAQVVAEVNKVIASGGGNLRLDAVAIGNVIASGGGNVIASDGVSFNADNVIIAEGAPSADGGNVIASGGGNFVATNSGTRRLAGAAKVRSGTARRWMRARLAQTADAAYGSVGYATDGEVLALRNYSGIAMSTPGASIFGNGEGITEQEVKDAARSDVILIGNQYTLVELG